MSNTFTVHPILGCLTEVQKKTKKEGWRPVNEIQARFLTTCLLAKSNDLPLFEKDEIKSFASSSIEEVNQWLTENGFPDLNLDLLDSVDTFGVASILHAFLKWKKQGKETTFICPLDQGEYPAVELDDNDIEFYKIDGHDHPVAVITTQRDGEIVVMTICEDEPPLKNKIEFMKDIMEGRRQKNMNFLKNYEKIIFPMVDYDEQVDISFLKNMENVDIHDRASGRNFIIEQAIQQTRFKMNHIGAEVESAAAMSMFKCASFEPKETIMKIDRPFFLGIFREDMKLPYFLGYFDCDNWKKPEIDFE